jgi:hypothetical protein
MTGDWRGVHLRHWPKRSIVALIIACVTPLSFVSRADDSVATFVGSETCAGCHQAEAARWRQSQHRLAMSHATAKSVLGNFDNATFDYFGARSRFFKRDGKFFIETDGPGGTLGVFEIKYTFGVDPLQQYLVEFPDGRLQALPIAWDTRPTKSGGQRWFQLYPDEPIRHDDTLHWTKLYQNWNFMCAECHSTGIHKNYDAAADRFNTTWAEISVGCEACHGQGSKHVAWARAHNDQAAASQSNDLTKGFSSNLTSERTFLGRTIKGQTSRFAAHLRRRCARRWKLAGSAMRAARNSPNDGFRAAGFPTLTSSHRSRKASMRLTGRCWMKSTITAHSNKAACLPPASPAATATSRTATNCALSATAFAYNATKQRNTPLLFTVGTPTLVRP